MADEGQVKLLKQKGVRAWNRWRAANPEIRPNLKEACFYRAHLMEADLTGTDLSGTDLSRAELRGAKLTRANLERANLSGAYLTEADLNETSLAQSDFSHCIMFAVRLEMLI